VSCAGDGARLAARDVNGGGEPRGAGTGHELEEASARCVRCDSSGRIGGGGHERKEAWRRAAAGAGREQDLGRQQPSTDSRQILRLFLFSTSDSVGSVLTEKPRYETETEHIGF
jgi:hypothetical protein